MTEQRTRLDRLLCWLGWHIYEPMESYHFYLGVPHQFQERQIVCTQCGRQMVELRLTPPKVIDAVSWRRLP